MVAAAASAVGYVVALRLGGQPFEPASHVEDLELVSVLAALAVISYAVGARLHAQRSAFAIALLLLAFQWGHRQPFPAVITLGLWLVGRLLRGYREIDQHLQERATDLEREQQHFDAEAVRYERARIARELHDIIGHSLSVAVILAGAGQRLPAGDRVGCVELLNHIATLVQQANDDVSRLTELLHEPHGVSAPDIRQRIRSLMDSVSASGTPIQASVEGDMRQLAAPIGVLACRVIEEGVTNALKHAPGACINIELRCQRNSFHVAILNAASRGSRFDLAALGAGHGLTGLAERAQVLGANLSSGPLTSGGWQLIFVADSVETAPFLDRKGAAEAADATPGPRSLTLREADGHG